MKKHLLVLSLVSILAACQNSKTKSDASATADPHLAVSMQSLKAQMDQLLPLLLDPVKFRDPRNQKEISERIRTFERTSQNVTHSTAISSDDPTLDFLSKGFHADIERSREAFEQNKIDYARTNLLNTTAYCIECHTRTNSGPNFQGAALQQTLSDLRRLDRAEYLLATRQFDGALKELDQLLKEGTKKEGVTVFDLDKAAHMALQITVRYQQNPDKALAIVEDILKSPGVPFYLKSNAGIWKQSLHQWKSEKSKKGDPLEKSRELVRSAQKKKTGRDDHAGDIEMMRVQALIQPILSAEKKSERVGEALFLMGQAYESARDWALWSLHEDYYEACIRRAPHSSWAKACYRNLEASTYLGYTGSSSTSVPADVQKKLGDLKTLAL